jgi:hypothetical protein
MRVNWDENYHLPNGNSRFARDKNRSIAARAGNQYELQIAYKEHHKNKF